MTKFEVLLGEEKFEVDENLKESLIEFIKFLTYKTKVTSREYLLALIKRSGHKDFWSFTETMKKTSLPRTEWGSFKAEAIIGWIEDELSCDEKDGSQILEHLVKIGALRESAFGNYK